MTTASYNDNDNDKGDFPSENESGGSAAGQNYG